MRVRSASKAFPTEWSGWSYASGLAFMMAGAIALLITPVGAVASTLVLGVLFYVAGVSAIFAGSAHIKRGGALFTMLIGGATLLAGMIIVTDPADTQTSVRSIYGWLAIGGVLELMMAARSPRRRMALLLVALADFSLAAVLLALRHDTAAATAGYFAGISFILRGRWPVTFACDRRRVVSW